MAARQGEELSSLTDTVTALSTTVGPGAQPVPWSTLLSFAPRTWLSTSDVALARLRARQGAEEPPRSGSTPRHGALALSSMHHWQDLGRGLAEAFRVLLPQGRLLSG